MALHKPRFTVRARFGSNMGRKRPKPPGGLFSTPAPLVPEATKQSEETPEQLQSPKRSIVTVTEAARRVRQVIEKGFAPLWIVGEVSNARRPRSGHLYFTLKDGRSILHIVIFRSNLDKNCPVIPKNGMEILVHGQLSAYEKGSEIQVIADRIEPHGKGAIELHLEDLRRKFSAAGLFAEERKKALPRFPRRIGVVTSPTGAAIRDILTTLDRRWPRLEIVIAPVRVQGEGAAQQIGQAIDDLGSLQPSLDLIILSRGGGSAEHLWCYNLEPVVHAMARAKLPIVTGVGHEVDETLADLVADVRMPTPTAAAEAIVPELSEVTRQLDELGARLHERISDRLKQGRQKLDMLRDRLNVHSLDNKVEAHREALQDLRERFKNALERRLERSKSKIQELEQRFHRSLEHAVDQQHKTLENHQARLHQAIRSRLVEQRTRFQALGRERFDNALRYRLDEARSKLAESAARLEALSPLKVLARGYSVTSRRGRVIRNIRQVRTGDRVEIRLAGGTAHARVEHIERGQDHGQRSEPTSSKGKLREPNGRTPRISPSPRTGRSQSR